MLGHSALISSEEFLECIVVRDKINIKVQRQQFHEPLFVSLSVSLPASNLIQTILKKRKEKTWGGGGGGGEWLIGKTPYTFFVMERCKLKKSISTTGYPRRNYMWPIFISETKIHCYKNKNLPSSPCKLTAH